MFRALWILFLSVACASAACYGQSTDYSDPAKLKDLMDRAQKGEAHAQSELGTLYEYGYWVRKSTGEALQWLDKAAAQGDDLARHEIGQIYFEGNGVERDLDEAAFWYGCPKLSAAILAGCREIRYDDLPEGARDLLFKMNCEVNGASNYDYGSAVDLAGNGTLAYQYCCHESPHGPCSAVVIGKVGEEWKQLSPKGGLSGIAGACTQFLVLESEHGGFHDICLPHECSKAVPAKGGACVSSLWQFGVGRYRSVANLTPTGHK